MVFILAIILSAIPAFLLVRALFGVRSASGVRGWAYYWLAAVIAFIASPVLAIIGVALVGEIFSLPDMEFIGWVIGPLGAIGIMGGILGAVVAIILRFGNQ